MIKEQWRLIWVEEAANCYFNMALDKAISEAVASKDVPNTIRLYRWKPSAVSIGYFQSMTKVVDIENCKKFKIDYIRRITGGGAVYHDFEGELTYSVNYLETNSKLPRDIMKIYEVICGGIVLGLGELGVEAEFMPINDIALKRNGKKISGSALTRRNGVISQHGTILRKVNAEKMFSVLIVPDEKFKEKMISSAMERVSSLEIELGKAPSFKEIRESLIIGFEKKLNVELLYDTITPNEYLEAEKIATDMFKDEKWLFKH